MKACAIKVEPAMTSWDDVDRELKALSDLSRNLTLAKARYEAQIEAVKARMKRETESILQDMDDRAREIYLYALSRRDDLRGRSKRLLHGAVAFRLSQSVKLPRDQKKVIEALKRLGKPECVDVSEKIKKLELKKQDPSILEAVGAKLVERDNFRIELPDCAFEFEKKLKAVSAH